MSDFLYSSENQSKGSLAEKIRSIYLEDPPKVTELHGTWGSLAVSEGKYKGFAPFETNTHICIVIGGPVLHFRDNQFLRGGDPHAGTRAIMDRWLRLQMDWQESLEGPFVVLIIEKSTGKVTCVTDLMMFIPVYAYCDDYNISLGTHVDALARATHQTNHYDEVSIADFVLYDVVTFPYTVYQNVRQCSPATIHCWQTNAGHRATLTSERKSYWAPKETMPYQSLGDAAFELHQAVSDYINKVTSSVETIAQFISAGEDSRALAGLISSDRPRDGYIFLDSMNKEGRIAKRVADCYGVNLKVCYREDLYYLRIIEQASALVGGGHQYAHAHALGFHKPFKLSSYDAVFGGYLSDSILKAAYCLRPEWLRRLRFMPQIALNGEARSRPVTSSWFSRETLDNVTQRRRAHLNEVAAIRPKSAHEWFVLWPMTMRTGITNLYSNRRLFASYEPFMANRVVKVGASVPVSWKLNRRLFHRAFRTELKRSWYLRHAEGWYPYFPWWLNTGMHLPIWVWEKTRKMIGLHGAHPGHWTDWEAASHNPDWKRTLSLASTGTYSSQSVTEAVANGGLNPNPASRRTTLNLLQLCYLTKAYESL